MTTKTSIVGIEALDSVIPAKSLLDERSITRDSCESAVAQAMPEVALALLFGRKVMVNTSYATDSPTAIEIVGSILAARPGIDDFDWPNTADDRDRPEPNETPKQPFSFGGLSDKSYGQILLDNVWSASESGSFHSSAWGGDEDAMRRTLAAATAATDRAQVLQSANEAVGRQIDRLPGGFSIGQLHAVADEYDRLKSQRFLQAPDFTQAPALGGAIAWLATLSEPLAIKYGLDPVEAKELQTAAYDFVNYLSISDQWKPAFSRTLCHSPQHVSALSSEMSPEALIGLREFVDTCYNHVVNHSLGAQAPMMSEPVTQKSGSLLDTAELAAYLWIGWLDDTLRSDEISDDPGEQLEPVTYPYELTKPASVQGLCTTIWEVISSREWYESFQRVHKADRLLERRSSDPRDDEWKLENYEDKVGEHAEVISTLIARYGRGSIWSRPGSIAMAIEKGGRAAGGAGAGARLAGLYLPPLIPVAGVLSLTAGVARSLSVGGGLGGRIYDGSVRRRRIVKATKAYAENHIAVSTAQRSGHERPSIP